ncbi:hypothetical protein AB6A40_006143 [Gnathostoma spinigerum]|uniref:Cytoplasmic dynein 2 light intermediate chain 1 n=1 Tax=Gnathostoma spinigerum TaxID=75299 RepID=A0ABD6EMQ6_9BILA
MSLDIWELAKQQKRENLRRKAERDQNITSDDSNISHGDEFGKHNESYIIVCGSKNCGKTSLIHRFLDQNDKPKPTVALEYTYGRRTRGATKDIAHIWELAGGTALIDLLDIPLSPSHIHICSVILMVDLTQMSHIWATTYTILNAIRSRAEVSLKNRAQMLQISDDSSQSSNAPYLKDPKDSEYVQPFPIPIAIVCSKYDEFQNFEPETRKNICKVLRFIAHSNGAILQMTSNYMENLASRSRALFGHFAFGISLSKTVQSNPSKPLYFPVGYDSFQEIGEPPSRNSSFGGVSRGNLMAETWRLALDELQPQTAEQSETKDDPASDVQFREIEIDTYVERRTCELETYIKHKRDRAALTSPSL